MRYVKRYVITVLGSEARDEELVARLVARFPQTDDAHLVRDEDDPDGWAWSTWHDEYPQ